MSVLRQTTDYGLPGRMWLLEDGHKHQFHTCNGGPEVCVRCGHSRREVRNYRRVIRELDLIDRRYQKAYKHAFMQAAVLKERSSFSLNTYTAICWDPKTGDLREKDVPSGACYAGLRYYDAGGYEPRYLVDRSLVKDDQICEDWLEWVYKYSPYRHAFVNDINHFKKTLCTITNAEKYQAQYFVGATMLIRYMREKRYIIKGWRHLYKFGMNPLIAWIISEGCDFNQEENVLYPGSWNNGHTVLSSDMSRIGLNNLLNERIQPAGKVGQTPWNYSGLTWIWEGSRTKLGRPLTFPNHCAVEQVVSRTFGASTKLMFMVTNMHQVATLQQEFLAINGARYEHSS